MTDNTQFNVAEFMNETIDAQFDTKRILIPEGEHLAMIGTGDKDVDLTHGVSTKGATPKPWLRLDMMLDFTDPNLAQQLMRDQVRGRYSIMLDLNEAGKLDTRPQRNINLGKLRDAVNQNRPGPWSWNQLKGQPLKVKVKWATLDNGEQISEIVSCTKAM